MLVLLKKRSVESTAIFTFAFSLETLYAKTDFELTILLWKSVATEQKQYEIMKTLILLYTFFHLFISYTLHFFSFPSRAHRFQY